MFLLMKIIFFGGILGNSSQVSDGAGAVLLMKRRTALEKNLPILGVFRYVFLPFFLSFLFSSTLFHSKFGGASSENVSCQNNFVVKPGSPYLPL